MNELVEAIIAISIIYLLIIGVCLPLLFIARQHRKPGDMQWFLLLVGIIFVTLFTIAAEGGLISQL